MENQENTFRTKSSDRIQINNILAAASITILSLLLGISNQARSPWIVVQLAMAIPLLVTSSMSYAKLNYRPQKEFKIWDYLGWCTLSVGYVMMLNALGLMLYISGYYLPSIWFLIVTIACFTVYSGLDAAVNKKRVKEKVFKFTVYMFIIFGGAIFPIFAGLV